MTYQTGLLKKLRDYFAERTQIIVHSSDPAYMSIRVLAKRSGLSGAKVRAIMVTETRTPTLEEFDALLHGLDIDIEGLLLPKSEAAPDALTSSLEAHLHSIMDTADGLIDAGNSRSTIIAAGRIVTSAAAIADLYGVGRGKKEKIKKVLPEY